MKIELKKSSYKKGQQIKTPDGLTAIIVGTPSPMWLRKFIRFITAGKIDKTQKNIYNVWAV